MGKLKHNTETIISILIASVFLTLVILSRQSVNSGGTSLPIIILFTVFFALIILVGLRRPVLKPHVYAIFLFAFTLSWLLTRSLIGDYLFGNDIYAEYHAYRLTAEAGMWYLSDIGVMGCLSVSFFPFVLEKLTGISGLMWFKFGLLVPVAAVPAICFYAYKKYLGTRIAYWSALIIILQSAFIYNLSHNCRVGLGMLCLALILWAFSKDPGKLRTILLFISIGMAVTSYYVVALAVCFILPLYWLLQRLLVGGKKESILLFGAWPAIATFVWWGLVNSWFASFLKGIFLRSIEVTQTEGLLSPLSRGEGASIVFSFVFIMVFWGGLIASYNLRKYRHSSNLTLLGLSALLVFASAVIMPAVSFYGSLLRLFLTLSVFYSPFFILGALKLARFCNWFHWHHLSACFLVAFLLFQFSSASGFINVTVRSLKSETYLVALMEKTFEIRMALSRGGEIFGEDSWSRVYQVDQEEVDAAKWILNDSRHIFGEIVVYTSTQRYPGFGDVFEFTDGADRVIVRPLHSMGDSNNGYIFITPYTIKSGKRSSPSMNSPDNGGEYLEDLTGRELVFTNGKAMVFK